jgi:hypothetical protein
MTRSLALAACLLLLAACAGPEPDPVTDPVAAEGAGPIDVTPGLNEQEPDTCKAADLAALIGQPAAAVAAAGITRPSRIVPLGGLVSQDYDASRVNFRLDAAGLVARIDCG